MYVCVQGVSVWVVRHKIRHQVGVGKTQVSVRQCVVVETFLTRKFASRTKLLMQSSLPQCLLGLLAASEKQNCQTLRDEVAQVLFEIGLLFCRMAYFQVLQNLGEPGRTEKAELLREAGTL